MPPALARTIVTELFPMDQGNRIEHKLDGLAALIHKEIGAAPLRESRVSTLQQDVTQVRLELQLLRDEQNKAKGSLLVFKWLATLGGGSGVAAAVLRLLELFQ